MKTGMKPPSRTVFMRDKNKERNTINLESSDTKSLYFSSISKMSLETTTLTDFCSILFFAVSQIQRWRRSSMKSQSILSIEILAQGFTPYSIHATTSCCAVSTSYWNLETFWTFFEEMVKLVIMVILPVRWAVLDQMYWLPHWFWRVSFRWEELVILRHLVLLLDQTWTSRDWDCLFPFEE